MRAPGFAHGFIVFLGGEGVFLGELGLGLGGSLGVWRTLTSFA